MLALLRHIFILMGLPCAAAAAEIETIRATSDLPNLVFVTGELAYGDDVRFRAALNGIDRGIVGLHSPGGNLDAGIEIGKAIRFRGLDTAVGPGSVCFSACALAWLAGHQRYLAPDAYVGFHAASIEKNGTLEETGMGNARVGAYLTNLGLSEQAVIEFTLPPPDQLKFLTGEMITRLNLNVTILTRSSRSDAGSTAMPQAPTAFATPPGQPSLHERAGQVVLALFEAPKKSGKQDYLRFLTGIYAETVDHFGKRKNRQEILAEADAYANRWPDQTITVKAAPLVTCSSNTCQVRGDAYFDARSAARNAHATGSFRYEIFVRDSGGRVQIVSQTSEVLNRSTVPLDRTNSLVWDIQKALARAGCQPGPVDGIWGSASAGAMRRFNARTRQRLPAEVPTQHARQAVVAARPSVCSR